MTGVTVSEHKPIGSRYLLFGWSNGGEYVLQKGPQERLAGDAQEVPGPSDPRRFHQSSMPPLERLNLNGIVRTFHNDHWFLLKPGDIPIKAKRFTICLHVFCLHTCAPVLIAEQHMLPYKHHVTRRPARTPEHATRNTSGQSSPVRVRWGSRPPCPLETGGVGTSLQNESCEAEVPLNKLMQHRTYMCTSHGFYHLSTCSYHTPNVCSAF